MNFRQWYHVGFIALSGFLLGYDLCFIGSILVDVQRSLELCYPCAEGTTNEALAECNCPAKSFAVSSVSIGAIVGGLAGGALAEGIGRRKALMLTDFLFFVGAASMALADAKNAWMFYAGRIVSGAALGAGGSTSSAYIAEISPPDMRGRLMEINELMVCAGCLIAFILAAVFGDLHWRYTVWVAALPAVLQLIGLTGLLYESPRWLAGKGKTTRATRAAEKLAMDVASVLGETGKEGSEKRRKRDALKSMVSYIRPLIVAVGCALAHNATAANTVLYYSRNVLQRAGIEKPLIANIAVGGVKFGGVCVALATVDRFGRRIMLLIGTAGIVLSYLGLICAFAQNEEDPLQNLALGSMLAFILAWDVSWAGLMLVIASELLPQPVRSVGVGLVYSTYNAVSFFQEQKLEWMFKTLSVSGTFAFFGFLSCLSFAFVYKCVPETGGASLEQIEDATEEVELCNADTLDSGEMLFSEESGSKDSYSQDSSTEEYPNEPVKPIAVH